MFEGQHTWISRTTLLLWEFKRMLQITLLVCTRLLHFSRRCYPWDLKVALCKTEVIALCPFHRLHMSNDTPVWRFNKWTYWLFTVLEWISKALSSALICFGKLFFNIQEPSYFFLAWVSDLSSDSKLFSLLHSEITAFFSWPWGLGDI